MKCKHCGNNPTTEPIFKVGDRVAITEGQHEGDIGIIKTSWIPLLQPYLSNTYTLQMEPKEMHVNEGDIVIMPTQKEKP